MTVSCSNNGCTRTALVRVQGSNPDWERSWVYTSLRCTPCLLDRLAHLRPVPFSIFPI